MAKYVAQAFLLPSLDRVDLPSSKLELKNWSLGGIEKQFYLGQKRQDINMREFKGGCSATFSIQDHFSVIF